MKLKPDRRIEFVIKIAYLLPKTIAQKEYFELQRSSHTTLLNKCFFFYRVETTNQVWISVRTSFRPVLSESDSRLSHPWMDQIGPCSYKRARVRITDNLLKKQHNQSHFVFFQASQALKTASTASANSSFKPNGDQVSTYGIDKCPAIKNK